MTKHDSHPAFPQPGDPSAVPWRYMRIDKFKYLLDCSRLVMPSADRLGDPLEGTTPEGDLKWWRRQAMNANSEDERHILEHNRAILSRMAVQFRSSYYVSCWHMNPHENHAMWECYANHPDSVAVRTTYEALRECLPNYVQMGIIRYIDYGTERLPSMNMFEYIMHKESYYAFECEVRAVASAPVAVVADTHFSENLFAKETEPDFHLYAPMVNLKQLIHGLVLHPEASGDFQVEVDHLCTKSGLPSPEASRRNRKPVF
jgi:hypothetical protein